MRPKWIEADGSNGRRAISKGNFYSKELYLPGNKSSLVNEIVSKCHNIPEDTSIDTYIFDGGRLPYWNKPKKQETFAQYASGTIKFLEFLFHFYIRIHIIYDVYRKNSLKATTRDKRRRGVR